MTRKSDVSVCRVQDISVVILLAIAIIKHFHS